MARAIVIPLYPHTSDGEIAEILETLRGVGLDDPVVVSGYIFPESVLDATERELEAVPGVYSPDQMLASTTPIAGRPGWRRDREGREWYSSEWLDRRLA